MTPIYKQLLEKADAGELASDGELTRQVWGNTPWIIDVYLGEWDEVAHERESDINAWCREHFGEEAWPIHGRDGRWRSGSAIVNNWTWYGFDTEEAMQQFMAAWPDNVKKGD